MYFQLYLHKYNTDSVYLASSRLHKLNTNVFTAVQPLVLMNYVTPILFAQIIILI